MGGGLSTRRAIAAAPFAATRTTRATPARAGVAAPPATGVDADPTDDDGSGWDAPGGDFVQSRARGLAAIRAFDAAHPAQTLSDVARRAGLSRATARRVLHTLVGLGYADSDGRLFRLRPKVLELGFAYLHGTGLWGAAQPPMVELVERIHESCSAAVLDGDEIVYVARVPTRTRIMSITLGLGSRLPAHLTSMGRVLLAALPPAELDARLAAAARAPARRGRARARPRGRGTPRRRAPSPPTPTRCAARSRRSERRVSRSSTRSSNPGCARSRCRCTDRAVRWSPRSTSARTRRASRSRT